jgi:RND superfamily putative drug exporter
MEASSVVNSPRNLAARAGRWSARHPWKAILAWLAFVIAAVMIGGAIGTQTLSDEEYGVGESGHADKVVGEAFPDEEDETVLVQSEDGLTANDPRFRATVDDVIRELGKTEDEIIQLKIDGAVT